MKMLEIKLFFVPSPIYIQKALDFTVRILCKMEHLCATNTHKIDHRCGMLFFRQRKSKSRQPHHHLNRIPNFDRKFVFCMNAWSFRMICMASLHSIYLIYCGSWSGSISSIHFKRLQGLQTLFFDITTHQINLTIGMKNPFAIYMFTINFPYHPRQSKCLKINN